MSPSPGVTIVSMGFVADKDPNIAGSPTFTMPAGGTAQFVVQYRVDCAAVTLAWPYLGDITVLLTSGSQTSIAPLQPPITSSGHPPAPPCTAPSP
jgi:hypothetical protein